MCLAVPAKVHAIEGDEGVVELHGNVVRVSTVLVPDTTPGDWVLVHAGFAIQRMTEREAQDTFEVLADMATAHDATRLTPTVGGAGGAP